MEILKSMFQRYYDALTIDSDFLFATCNDRNKPAVLVGDDPDKASA